MNEYEEYEEQFNREEIENAIQGEFVIDNDSKAEWAIRKIKEAQDETRPHFCPDRSRRGTLEGAQREERQEARKRHKLLEVSSEQLHEHG